MCFILCARGVAVFSHKALSANWQCIHSQPSIIYYNISTATSILGNVQVLLIMLTCSGVTWFWFVVGVFLHVCVCGFLVGLVFCFFLFKFQFILLFKILTGNGETYPIVLTA